MAKCQIAINLVEACDVFCSVIRWERDSGQQYANMCGSERIQNDFKVFLSLIKGQTAQAIISAKLHDDNGRVESKHTVQTFDGIFGRSPARTKIHDSIMKSEPDKVALKRCGVGLVRRESVAGRYAVAIANYDGARALSDGSGWEEEAD